MATNTINLKSPRELLAVMPFVLGFKPARSLVVLCLSEHRLGLTQRLDLPRPEHAHQVVSALMPSLAAENPESVVLLGYENHAGDSQPALQALTEALISSGVQIHDRLVVRHAGGAAESPACVGGCCHARMISQWRLYENRRSSSCP